MTKEELLRAMQKHVAQISANSSSIRKQGALNMVAAAQQFLSACDLSSFVTETEEEFLRQLDVKSERLRQAFPDGGQNWGTARKILNIFLRDAAYNRYLANEHHLEKIERWLEVPLDSHVASNLPVQATAYRFPVPKWTTIKGLTPDDSKTLQRLAQIVADSMPTLRAHLDLLWWRNPARRITPVLSARATVRVENLRQA